MELVGLSYACLKWLSRLNDKGYYRHKNVVKIQNGEELSWNLGKWAEKIKDNFELNFFVSKDNTVDKNPHLINKVGIYKDTLNSGLPWSDYQLR